jgi:competence protein ComFB
MSIIDSYNFEFLKNEAELLVLHELERQLETQGPDICRCNECIVDMAAMALNSVKPLYRVSLLGTQYAAQAMNEHSYAKSVRKAVTQAIDRVKINPGQD